jgi:predicted HTH transcriptional regulator
LPKGREERVQPQKEQRVERRLAAIFAADVAGYSRNLHTGLPDDKIQLSALKTIAGFLNAKGGVLLIGVSDGGDVLGLEPDGFPSEDKMALHLVNLVRDRLGDVFLPYVHPHFEEEDGLRVLSIRCEKGPKPAFVKDGGVQRFFVRGGNATAELHGVSITDYVKQRFG